MDMKDVKNQDHAKRGLEVAAAGSHSILLIGPPNAGKKMLADRMKTITDMSIYSYNLSDKKIVAKFNGIIIAIMEPCPCGFFTDPKKECHCTPYQIQRHLSKIPQVLLDKIDIHLEVPRLSSARLTKRQAEGENSETIKKRVEKAKAIQFNRPSVFVNSRLNGTAIDKYCVLDKEGEDLLKMAILELGLSARAYDKVLKISRSIADLEGKEKIEAHHISEAIGYRALDRNLWA